MGAGISQKQMNRYYYTRLKKIQRELQAAGVNVLYRKFQLYPDTTGRKDLAGFNIHFNTLRASNGETVGLLTVTIQHHKLPMHEKIFRSSFALEGIELIKTIFSQHPRVGQADWQ